MKVLRLNLGQGLKLLSDDVAGLPQIHLASLPTFVVFVAQLSDEVLQRLILRCIQLVFI